MELTRLICVLALAGAVGACGSDLTSTGDGTEEDGGGGTGGSTGPTDACLNLEDTAVFESLTYDDEGTEVSGSEAASAIGGDCVLLSAANGGCIDETNAAIGAPSEENIAALAACIQTCTNNTIADNTDPSGMLSADCISCYGGAASCGATFCAGECAADVNAPPCTACRDLPRPGLPLGCNGAFDVCSGFFD